MDQLKAMQYQNPHHTLSAFSLDCPPRLPPHRYKQAMVGASPPFENIHIHVFEVRMDTDMDYNVLKREEQLTEWLRQLKKK